MLPASRWTFQASSNWTDEKLLRAPKSEWLCAGCVWVRENRMRLWSGGQVLAAWRTGAERCGLDGLPELLLRLASGPGKLPCVAAVKGRGTSIQQHLLFRGLDGVTWSPGEVRVLLCGAGDQTFRGKGLDAGPLWGSVPVRPEEFARRVAALEEALISLVERRAALLRSQRRSVTRGGLSAWAAGSVLDASGAAHPEGILALLCAAERAARRVLEGRAA
jgi:hypothetical protein